MNSIMIEKIVKIFIPVFLIPIIVLIIVADTARYIGHIYIYNYTGDYPCFLFRAITIVLFSFLYVYLSGSALFIIGAVVFGIPLGILAVYNDKCFFISCLIFVAAIIIYLVSIF